MSADHTGLPACSELGDGGVWTALGCSCAALRLLGECSGPHTQPGRCPALSEAFECAPRSRTCQWLGTAASQTHSLQQVPQLISWQPHPTPTSHPNTPPHTHLIAVPAQPVLPVRPGGQPGVGRHQHQHPSRLDEGGQAAQEDGRVGQPAQQVGRQHCAGGGAGGAREGRVGPGHGRSRECDRGWVGLRHCLD